GLADRHGERTTAVSRPAAGTRNPAVDGRGSGRGQRLGAGEAVERGGVVTTARVAVVQFPGVNCEAETVRALARVGLSSEVFRWTRPAAQLEAFAAYVLPGGFSYQDRVRA